MKIWRFLPIPENVISLPADIKNCTVYVIDQAPRSRKWGERIAWLARRSTGVYYVIGYWRDEVVCFSKGCSLCLGIGLRKLVVFFSSGEEENDHNFILNLYTERLCKLWKSVNTDHARPCFCGTSLQLFLKVPEKVNCFSQIASCQIGSVIFQVLVDYFSSLVNSPHIVKPSF